MFSTIASAQIDPQEPVHLDDEVELYWRNVRMSFVQPYFHVLMSPRIPAPDQSAFTVLIADVGQLQLSLRQPASVVREVQVVTPGTINLTGRWQMHELDSIYAGLEGEFNGRECYAFVYITTDGKRFLHASKAKSEDEVGPLGKVFTTPDW